MMMMMMIMTIILMMMMTIILMMMILIINNIFHNFNEAFSYQLIVYPTNAVMQSESVLWNAVVRHLLLPPKVQFN